MTTKFLTLLYNTPIIDAVNTFKEASEEQGRRVFGLMVTNETGRLVGMISMYDILLFMRPKHIHIWGMMDDIEVIGLIDNSCERAKSIYVGDIMSSEVITISPQTHLMMVLDIMIKKHIRRLPVIENDKIVGIVYISDLFYHLLDRISV